MRVYIGLKCPQRVVPPSCPPSRPYSRLFHPSIMLPSCFMHHAPCSPQFLTANLLTNHCGTAHASVLAGVNHQSTGEREEVLRGLHYLLELALHLTARVLASCRPAGATVRRRSEDAGRAGGVSFESGHPPASVPRTCSRIARTCTRSAPDRALGGAPASAMAAEREPL